MRDIRCKTRSFLIYFYSGLSLTNVWWRKNLHESIYSMWCNIFIQIVAGFFFGGVYVKCIHICIKPIYTMIKETIYNRLFPYGYVFYRFIPVKLTTCYSSNMFPEICCNSCILILYFILSLVVHLIHKSLLNREKEIGK